MRVKGKEAGLVRLNKYLSQAGICSRREADLLIREGRVTVDGQRALMGMQVDPARQEIRVGKKLVEHPGRRVVLAVHKPAGIVCTEDRRERKNIIRFLDYPKRITYAGRLDKDSTGLLLMTNDGDLINRLMRARYHHEKEYRVRVDREIQEAFLERMRSGVPILDTVTRPCEVFREGKYTFRIILTQGLNRQIRRMCEALGYRVTELCRIRICNITLGNLKEGDYRELTPEELEGLYRELEGEAQGERNPLS